MKLVGNLVQYSTCLTQSLRFYPQHHKTRQTKTEQQQKALKFIHFPITQIPDTKPKASFINLHPFSTLPHPIPSPYTCPLLFHINPCNQPYFY